MLKGKLENDSLPALSTVVAGVCHEELDFAVSALEQVVDLGVVGGSITSSHGRFRVVLLDHAGQVRSELGDVGRSGVRAQQGGDVEVGNGFVGSGVERLVPVTRRPGR